MSTHSNPDDEPSRAFEDEWWRYQGSRHPMGYHDAGRAGRWDVMKEIEVSIAKGVHRWITSEDSGPAYDYWLISFGVYVDQPAEWQTLCRRVWNEMGAYDWLSRIDASRFEHYAWQGAMRRVYCKLFLGTFDLPVEETL